MSEAATKPPHCSCHLLASFIIGCQFLAEIEVHVKQKSDKCQAQQAMVKVRYRRSQPVGKSLQIFRRRRGLTPLHEMISLGTIFESLETTRCAKFSRSQ